MVTVFRTEIYAEAVWIRDSEGSEHRIALSDLPPGPYHECGDCHCGKRKGNGSGPAGDGDGGNGGDVPEAR
jgi:hypothetical protein